MKNILTLDDYLSSINDGLTYSAQQAENPFTQPSLYQSTPFSYTSSRTTPVASTENPFSTQDTPSAQDEATEEPASTTNPLDTTPTPQTRKTSLQIKTEPREDRFNDKDKFIRTLYDAYKSELDRQGIDNSGWYALALAVQDGVESAWGTTFAGKWNYGNIVHNPKQSRGYTAAGDHRSDGTPYTNKFVNFNNIQDFVRYKIGFLNGNRYKAFTGDTADFGNRLVRGGYAEAQNYANTIMKIINQYVANKKYSALVGRYGFKFRII